MTPSRATVEAAAELLSAAASQTAWVFGCRTMPSFGVAVKDLAEKALVKATAGRPWYIDDRWCWGYAEAECLLRMQLEGMERHG